MITYSSFFRRVVCRRINQIKSPRVFTYQNFELPLGSVYYFYGENGVLGVNLNNPYIANWSRRRANYFVTQLDSLKGNPRKRVKSYRRVISRYYNTFPRMIRVRNEGALTRALNNPNYLVTIDFSLLDLGLVYLHNPMTNYNFWYNKEFTVWKKLAEIAKTTDKKHFIEIPAPTTVFDKGFLNRVSMNEFGPMFSSKVITRADFMEVEMWKWISPATRRSSIFHLIPEDKLDNVNLVYRAKDKFAILNMGLLNKWSQAIFEDGNDAEFSEDINDEDIDAAASEETGINYQWRRIIHLFFKVMNKLLQESTSTVQDKEIKESINVIDLTDDEIVGENADDISDDFGDEADLVEKSTLTNRATVKNIIDDDKKIIPFTPVNITPILKEIDNDVNLIKTLKRKQELKINAVDEGASILSDNIYDINEELKQYREEMGRTKPLIDRELVNNFNSVTPASSIIINEVIKNKGVGRISAAQVKFLTEKTNKYKEIRNPFDINKTIAQTIEESSTQDIKIEPKKVNDIPLTIDKSMLKITTELSDNLYIQKQMSNDILDVVVSIQNSGVILNDYNLERITDIMNDTEVHKLNVLTPANVSSTLNIIVPKIHEDGTMRVDGVRYIMKKQRVDKPIKKVSADRVALTSYYGKIFIDRTVKVKNNYGRWLLKEIDKLIIDKSPTIKSVMYGKCNIHKQDVGLSISAICENFSGFVLSDAVLDFKKATTRTKDGSSRVIIGTTSDGQPVSLDHNHQIYYGNEEKGDIETLLGINRSVPGVPIEYLTMKVLGSELSLGFILARYYGFYNLLKLLGVEPIRKLVKGTRFEPIVYPEYAITFADEILTFNAKDIIPAYILNGLNLFEKDLENYPVHIFDNKEVYSTILRDNDIKSHVEAELDLMTNMFIDPMCKKLLKMMGEPTSFNQLLIRACELLATNKAENEINMKDMLIRGYDKVAGTIYRELVNATRTYLRKPNGTKRKLEINPRAVELSLLTDPAVAVIDELNPIQSLKEREEVTLAGTGGRAKVTITQELRGFDESDLGIISEATKDSGTVAINTFLSAAPNINTIYGTADGLDDADANKNPAMVLSTSALLAPFSDREDLKRTVFTSIQRSHGIPVLGGLPALVRTGYEPMVAKRSTKLFSYCAKGKGVIRDVNKYQVVVEYDDPKLGKEVVSIGDKIIKSKDASIIHPLVCDLPVGHRFNEFDVLIYNKNYFTRDLLQPTEVVLIDQTYATTVLIENNDTLEDSGVITERFSKNMLTPVTKTETIIVTKNNTVNNLIKVGEKVELGDILCILEDEFINKNTSFDEASKQSLEEIQRNSPRSDYSGKIRRIECIYFCDFNDLSDSLKTIAKESDKQFYRENKDTENDGVRTGRITVPSRVNGKLVNMDEVAINIYIDFYDSMSGGDKDVNANQMKSVISKVYHGINKTKSGVPIDDVFSYTSIGNRIVDSPILIGLYGSGMLELNKRAIKAYRGK